MKSQFKKLDWARRRTVLDVAAITELRTSRKRWKTLLISTVAVGLSAGMLGAVLSVEISLSRLAIVSAAPLRPGVDLMVTGVTANGVPPGLAKAVSKLPGVQAAAPIAIGQVFVDGKQTVLVGADLRLASVEELPPVRLDPRSFSDHSVLVSQGFARAHRSTRSSILEPAGVNGATDRMSVSAIVPDSIVRGIPGSQVIVTTLRTAGHLLGGKGADVLLVRSSNHNLVARELRDRYAARYVVTTPDAYAAQTTHFTKSIAFALIGVAAMGMLVAAFVIFNLSEIGILGRRRDLATLGAIGMRPNLLAASLLIEPAVVGLIGGVLGIAISAVAGPAVLHAVPRFLIDALPTKPSYQQPALADVATVAIALVTSVGGSLLTVGVLARESPLRLVRDADLELGRWRSTRPRSVVLLLLATVASTAVAFGSSDPITSVAGVAVALIAAITLTWLVRGRAAAAAGVAVQRIGRTGFTVSAGIADAGTRLWSISMAVALAVAMVTTVAGVRSATLSASSTSVASLGQIDYIAAVVPPDVLETSGYLSDDLARTVANDPGVASVTADRYTFATVGGNRILLQGLGAGSRTPMFAAATATAVRDVNTGSAAILSHSLAQKLHAKAGQPIRLQTPDGARTVRVAAVVNSFSWPDGLLAISLPHLRSWFGVTGTSYLEVTARPGTDESALRSEIQQQIGSQPLYFERGTKAVDAAKGALGEVSALLYGVEILVVLSSVLAVIAGMSLTLSQRRRQFALVHAIGGGRTVPRLVAGHVVLYTALGSIVGLAFGALMERAGIQVVALSVSTPIAYHLSGQMFLVGAISAVTIAALTVWWPVLTIRRASTLTNLSYE